MKKYPAFTILEVLLIVATILILAVIVFIAINPAKSFMESRNMQRSENVEQIASAIYQYSVTNGTFPTGITSDWQVIGTGTEGCQLECGIEGSTVSNYQNIANSNTTFNGTHSFTQYSSGIGLLELTSAGRTSGSGTYTSPLFDAIAEANWESVTINANAPYNRELPNNGESETGYASGNMNMSGNVLLLHLNEQSGNIVYDSSGNNLHGTLYDPTKYLLNQPGKLNTALRFTNNSSNENGQLRVPHNNLLNFSTQGTVCAFVNLTDTSQRYAGFVKKGQLPNFSDEEYSLQMFTSSSQPIFNVVDTTGADNYVISSQSLSAGAWTHLCGTVNTSGSIKIFVNGVQRGSLTWPAGRTIRTATGSMQIGAQNISNSEYGMKGSIDEVAVFNRELSVSEIQAMYERAQARLRFQVRSCTNLTCEGSDYIGPDGTTGSYYEQLTGIAPTPFTLTNLPSGQYFQYQVLLSTSATALTPQISSITTSGRVANIITGKSCLNLKEDLVDEFIVNIPHDPQLGSEANTNYAVKATGPHRIAVKSCAAEGESIIKATK